jgi:hypothetical protein
VQRAVAEQHVDEPSGIVADGPGGERHADRERAVPLVGDRLHPADDLAADEAVVDRGQGRLDALLDRERLRPRLDGSRVAADAVDRLDTLGHGLHLVR